MGTKTISIGEDAYNLLSSYKVGYESFTDVIKKIAGNRSLLDLAGILTKNEAEDLRKHIKARRREFRERIEKTAKRVQ